MDIQFFNKLKEDLEKSGLASELKVRNILSKRGWSISGGAAYLDKDEGKSREIDIVSSCSAPVTKGEKCIVYNFFRLYAEVKKSEKPWIVFKHYPPQYLDSCAWDNIINAINLPCHPAILSTSLQSCSLIKVNGWQGTGIHEAFKNPDQPSRWYSAFLSAIKAATDYNEEYRTDGEKQTDNIIENPVEITFNQPLVVLDGILVSAELSENNDIILEEVKSAAFKFNYKTEYYNQSPYRVDVVTIDGLNDYLDIVEKRQVSLNEAIIKYSGIKI